MKPIIITDSNCDLTQEYLEHNHIISIPFNFQLNGAVYEDDFGQSMSHQNFYDSLRSGEMATSTQITPYLFEKYFEEYVSQGYAVIYIGFSSGLSDTFNNAMLARKAVTERNESADIAVIDTKGATSGQALLVHMACNMLKQGKTRRKLSSGLKQIK